MPRTGDAVAGGDGQPQAASGQTGKISLPPPGVIKKPPRVGLTGSAFLPGGQPKSRQRCPVDGAGWSFRSALSPWKRAARMPLPAGASAPWLRKLHGDSTRSGQAARPADALRPRGSPACLAYSSSPPEASSSSVSSSSSRPILPRLRRYSFSLYSSMVFRDTKIIYLNTSISSRLSR